MPEYWGRCDTCGDALEDAGRPLAYSTPHGTIRFRFCSGSCRDSFDDHEPHRKHAEAGQ